MQTRKKVLPRNASRENANPRSCRVQKKMVVLSEKKVTELITSSTKKQKSAGVSLKQNIYAKSGRNLGLDNLRSQDQNHSSEFPHQTSISHEDLSGGGTVNCKAETIFSPSFHHPKDICDKGLSEVEDKKKYHEMEDKDSKSGYLCHPEKLHAQEKYVKSKTAVACESNDSLCDVDYSDLGNLSSEVSAIYLAMQNSKLECSDEQSHDTISTDGCVDPEENDEFDDFDPYLFIKDLPALSDVVPRFRPFLLPKQTRSCPSTTLVLDLDETLVHSTLEPCEDADFTFPVNFNLKEHTIYVRCRPYLKDFLEKAFGFQLENGIPIESWFDNRNDRELLSLLPLLESLVGVDDVRPLIAKRFNLREKVAAAAAAAANCLSIDFRN